MFSLDADARAFLSHRTFHHQNDDHQRKHHEMGVTSMRS
jgi:hypothetical protein